MYVEDAAKVRADLRGPGAARRTTTRSTAVLPGPSGVSCGRKRLAALPASRGAIRTRHGFPWFRALSIARNSITRGFGEHETTEWSGPASWGPGFYVRAARRAWWRGAGSPAVQILRIS